MLGKVKKKKKKKEGEGRGGSKSIVETRILISIDIAKTSQCFGMLATAYRNTQNSLTWIKQYKEYAAGALVRLNTAVDTIKESLKNERRRIMDAVLAGHTAGGEAPSSSSTDNPPLFSTTYHGVNELPPPVYEAPPVDEQYNNQNQGTAQQDQHLPVIPSNLSPSTSFSNLPEMNGNNNNNNNNAIINSPLLPPPTNSYNNTNTNTPPHPITPILENANVPLTNNVSITATTPPTPPLSTSTNHNNQQTYISHNVNNPFQ